jgi:hypothetical protein
MMGPACTTLSLMWMVGDEIPIPMFYCVSRSVSRGCTSGRFIAFGRKEGNVFLWKLRLGCANPTCAWRFRTLPQYPDLS